MKKTLLIASLALLTAGTGLALAQPAPPPPPDAAMAPPPPDGPGRGAPPPRPRADFRGPAGGPARLADRGPMPPPSPGAHFHIERGGNVVDLKCADDEPMQACAAIARQFLTEGRKL